MGQGADGGQHSHVPSLEELLAGLQQMEGGALIGMVNGNQGLRGQAVDEEARERRALSEAFARAIAEAQVASRERSQDEIAGRAYSSMCFDFPLVSTEGLRQLASSFKDALDSGAKSPYPITAQFVAGVCHVALSGAASSARPGLEFGRRLRPPPGGAGVETSASGEPQQQQQEEEEEREEEERERVRLQAQEAQQSLETHRPNVKAAQMIAACIFIKLPALCLARAATDQEGKDLATFLGPYRPPTLAPPFPAPPQEPGPSPADLEDVDLIKFAEQEDADVIKHADGESSENAGSGSGAGNGSTSGGLGGEAAQDVLTGGSGRPEDDKEGAGAAGRGAGGCAGPPARDEDNSDDVGEAIVDDDDDEEWEPLELPPRPPVSHQPDFDRVQHTQQQLQQGQGRRGEGEGEEGGLHRVGEAPPSLSEAIARLADLVSHLQFKLISLPGVWEELGLADDVARALAGVLQVAQAQPLGEAGPPHVGLLVRKYVEVLCECLLSSPGSAGAASQGSLGRVVARALEGLRVTSGASASAPPGRQNANARSAAGQAERDKVALLLLSSLCSRLSGGSDSLPAPGGDSRGARGAGGGMERLQLAARQQLWTAVAPALPWLGSQLDGLLSPAPKDFEWVGEVERVVKVLLLYVRAAPGNARLGGPLLESGVIRAAATLLLTAGDSPLLSFLRTFVLLAAAAAPEVARYVTAVPSLAAKLAPPPPTHSQEQQPPPPPPPPPLLQQQGGRQGQQQEGGTTPAEQQQPGETGDSEKSSPPLTHAQFQFQTHPDAYIWPLLLGPRSLASGPQQRGRQVAMPSAPSEEAGGSGGQHAAAVVEAPLAHVLERAAEQAGAAAPPPVPLAVMLAHVHKVTLLLQEVVSIASRSGPPLWTPGGRLDAALATCQSATRELSSRHLAHSDRPTVGTGGAASASGGMEEAEGSTEAGKKSLGSEAGLRHGRDSAANTILREGGDGFEKQKESAGVVVEEAKAGSDIVGPRGGLGEQEEQEGKDGEDELKKRKPSLIGNKAQGGGLEEEEEEEIARGKLKELVPRLLQNFKMLVEYGRGTPMACKSD